MVDARSTSNEKRPFALLDVDLTLIGYHGEKNEALVNALLKSGIRDVYLFTDMTYHTVNQDLVSPDNSRFALIKYLEEKGIKVHGVVTKGDIMLKQEPGAVYNTYYKDRYVAGQRFDSSKADDNRIMKFTDSLKKQADQLAVDQKFEDKGSLIEYFLEHKPKEVGPMILFDDKIENAKNDLEKAAKKYNQAHPDNPAIIQGVEIKAREDFPGKSYQGADIVTQKYSDELNKFIGQVPNEQKSAVMSLWNDKDFTEYRRLKALANNWMASHKNKTITQEELNHINTVLHQMTTIMQTNIPSAFDNVESKLNTALQAKLPNTDIKKMSADDLNLPGNKAILKEIQTILGNDNYLKYVNEKSHFNNRNGFITEFKAKLGFIKIEKVSEKPQINRETQKLPQAGSLSHSPTLVFVPQPRKVFIDQSRIVTPTSTAPASASTSTSTTTITEEKSKTTLKQ